MKKYLLVFVIPFLISACSSSKQLEFSSLNQTPCRDQMEIKTQGEFTGETADNFTIYQQGDLVFASMDVRTTCNSRIAFDAEKKGEEIHLKLRNAGGSSSQSCVCTTSVTTSLKNVDSGTYKVLVTNERGNQILAQGSITVK